MEETLNLLESVSTAHGMPASEAAARLRSAMELIARIAAENAEHPELTKERYSLVQTSVR